MERIRDFKELKFIDDD